MGQNRACKINFNSFEYLSLQSAGNFIVYLELNLLKGLIEKDPKKRLTATQALNHQYFKMKF
jgi:serine/threonine protein kinase